MMKSVACIALIALVGSAAATIVPTVGDIGTLQFSSSEDSTTCSAQRAADEGEEGEDVGSTAPSQVCLDKCSHNGYTVTQEANTEVTVDGAVTNYRNIKLSPMNMACIEGCECPEGKGTMEEPEASDDQQAEVYVMTFFDRMNKTDKGYLAGELTVDYTEGEVDQIQLSVDYFAHETKDGKEEAREEQCLIKLFIATGKIGGITAASGAANPDPVQYHVGESLGGVDMVHEKSPAQGCAFGEEPADETEEADWCMYKCAQGYTVNIIDTTIVMIPKETFISLNCMCEVGYGVQNAGTSDTSKFVEAEVSFTQAVSNMCSSTFVGEIALVDVKATNAEANNAFTMKFATSAWTEASKQYCTYKYKVNSGEVLGIEASIDSEDESKGKVAFAMFLAVFVLFAFFVPGCLPKKGRNYDSVP